MSAELPKAAPFFRRKTTRLNLAYLLTTLGDRMWMFAIGIFMHKLGGMTYVAVQQFFDAIVKLLSLPLLGPYMDKNDRNRILQISLMVNNIAVACSAILFCICFYISVDEEKQSLYFVLFISSIILASISRLASEAQRICFTKDWVVVITDAYPEEGITLSTQNAYMNVTDQFSSVLLPAICGLMFDIFGKNTSCVIIIIYNFTSWLIESSILRSLYHATPALQNRQSEATSGGDEDNGCGCFNLRSVRLYFQQSSWMSGFGLSLLYMTVLGFDNLAGSYGQKHGLSLFALGNLRGIGSLLGLFGAAAFGKIAPAIGLLWTAFLGLTWQNVFILTSGVSTIMPGSPMNVTGFVDGFDHDEWLSDVVQKVRTPSNNDAEVLPFWQLPPSILVFFFGITLARFGLWLADPAITQIQQETIPERERYSVFAMQTAFCEGFSLIKDTIVILFSNTELFGALAVVSCIFVGCGYTLNIIYFLKCRCKNPRPLKKRKTTNDENDAEMQVVVSPERASLLKVDVETPKIEKAD